MNIGLVLSGGGTRAAVFHLGVLKYLAEQGMLDEVSRISTVSGGSLVTALIFSRNNMKWTMTKTEWDDVFSELETLLTTKSLLSKRSALNPFNWLYLHRRSALVARLLEQKWGVSGSLQDLPATPKWQINATTYQTGKNWHFSKEKMGDWVYGFLNEPKFPIAKACAASAAVPYALGALKLIIDNPDVFEESEYNNNEKFKPSERPKTLHLWDGGVYENLGTERFAKIGSSPEGCDFVLISDASAPLKPNPPKFFKNPFASPRLFDVTSEQTRSLRVRAFWKDKNNKALNMNGAHVPIGKTVKEIDEYNDKKRTNEEYQQFLSQEDVLKAARHSTTLKKLSQEDFNRLVRHGYENAQAAISIS